MCIKSIPPEGKDAGFRWLRIEVGQVPLAANRRSLLQDINLLCQTTAGLGAVVGPICVLMRTYQDVSAVSFFWLDAEGRPAGFFHDTAPAALKDLFITRFEELFDGPDEVNMMTLLQSRGPSIGQYLKPVESERFHRSNIRRYLCEPLGHHHPLDIRIDIDDAGRALCVSWRKEEQPFSRDDILRARPVQAALEGVILHEEANARWVSVAGGSGELVTDAAGERLLAIDAAADRLLMNSHLLNQRVSMTEPPQVPPAFALLLAAGVAKRGEAEMALAVPAGRLVARARLARTPGHRDAMLLISLRLEIAYDVLCVQYLLEARLTPMERRVALYGMQGGKRGACIAAMSTTPEAMKKHCAAIFARLNISAWGELEDLGQRLAAAHTCSFPDGESDRLS